MAQATDDAPRESATPNITKEQHESGEYTWDKNKESKVRLFRFNRCTNMQGQSDERNPPEEEVTDLKDCFRKLVGYMDFKKYEILNMTELPNIFDNEFQDDKKNMEYNCFIFIVLSIGENDKIFCLDDKFTITDFIEPIKKKQSMALKPKLFFIQNGDQSLNNTVEWHIVKEGPVQVEYKKVPQEADFFIMQSIIPESLFRHPSGTDECIFMTELIETIKDVKQTPGKIDIHQLSLQINSRVNNRITSATGSKSPMYFDRLPIPEVTSTLTKALYFP